MCGIAGLLSTDALRDPTALAQRLDQALAHRGPDDAGLWHEQGTFLLHRRLAILDLSPGGHQPMASTCGRWRLIFNGEIYNYRELRLQLEALGHRFSSSGDTEVLLQLLIRYGTAALDRLRGMFAFCLWDRHRQRALIARDPYGIKPLYLYRGSGGTLLFASELRALLATDLVPRRLDSEGLRQFLQLGHLPQRRTLVEGVQALPPGHLAQWQNGELQIQPYWQPSFAPAPRLAYADLVAHTRASLQQSVDLHLRSDVPVGLFLSGGLDSSALLALSPPGLHTLSIGFREAGFDESTRAEAISRCFHSQHTTVVVDATRTADQLEPFLAAVDQPSVDGFNSFCVSRLAHQQGLKVVLSGLGGDELFGGYPSFQRLPRAMAWQRRFAFARPLLAALLERSSSGTHQRLAHSLRQRRSLAEAFVANRGLFSPVETHSLLMHWGFTVDPSPPLAGPLLSDLDREAFPTARDVVAWLESSSYMGDQLLRDSDTFSMAWGLELRLPLVDHLLFRALAGQSSHHRLGPGKRLLRDAVPELQQLHASTSKQGFSFPFRQWFDAPGPLRHQLLAYSPSIPRHLDAQPWARRWALMVLQQWLQRHLGMSLG